MDKDARADMMAFCARHVSAAWARYWTLLRRERQRRVRGAAWLRQEPTAARERASRWHAGAVLVGLADEAAPFYRRARRRRIARPFNRNVEASRQKMAKSPGFVAGSMRARRREASSSGRAQN